jgi:hypothetical protein
LHASSLNVLIDPARVRASLSIVRTFQEKSMNVTAIKTFASSATEQAFNADGSPSHLAANKAIIGGGCITTPAVAAHVRRQQADASQRAPQQAAADRRALIGGGWITTPAVAAHMRRTMQATNQR